MKETDKIDIHSLQEEAKSSRVLEFEGRIDGDVSRKSPARTREELKRVNRELGVAIVHVTHDQIEAFGLGESRHYAKRRDRANGSSNRHPLEPNS
jgi:ABC-type proline/glycine betaine transport system ATPase subunit